MLASFYLYTIKRVNLDRNKQDRQSTKQWLYFLTAQEKI